MILGPPFMETPVIVLPDQATSSKARRPAGVNSAAKETSLDRGHGTWGMHTGQPVYNPILVGGWNIFYFPIYWE